MHGTATTRVTAFLETTAKEQCDMVWNALIGAGPMQLREAVRAAGEALREHGQLENPKNATSVIEQAIQAGLAQRLFDTPRRGHVRAILEKLTADDWCHCLLAAVPESPIARTDALRAAIEIARESFGASIEEHSGADRSVDAALKRCMKAGFIENLGAGLVARPTVVVEPRSATARPAPKPKKAKAPPSLEAEPAPIELPEVGLLIRTPYIDWILDGHKTWEIRSRRTERRGRIGLIRSQSGTVVGEANLVDVVGPLTLEDIESNLPATNHDGAEEGAFAWVLEGAHRYPTPIPYTHRSGAVIWARLR